MSLQGVLGNMVSDSRESLELMVSELEARLESQAPYFDDRLIQRIDNVYSIIASLPEIK